jgi:hypothetical protein
MLENSFLIDTRMKKFDTTVPATPLVGSLSKAQFCTRLGATRWLMCDPGLPGTAQAYRGQPAALLCHSSVGLFKPPPTLAGCGPVLPRPTLRWAHQELPLGGRRQRGNRRRPTQVLHRRRSPSRVAGVNTSTARPATSSSGLGPGRGRHWSLGTWS